MLAIRVLWMQYGRSMLDLTCLNTKVCVTSHKEGGWEGAIGAVMVSCQQRESEITKRKTKRRPNNKKRIYSFASTSTRVFLSSR